MTTPPTPHPPLQGVTYVNREEKFCQHTQFSAVFALETWVCWLPQEVLVRFRPASAACCSSGVFFFFFFNSFFCGFLHSSAFRFVFLASSQQQTTSSSSNRNRTSKWVRNSKVLFYGKTKKHWNKFLSKVCAVFEYVFQCEI